MKDKCILCAVDTVYDVDVNIDNRLFYVEGAGQLCKECYEETYE